MNMRAEPFLLGRSCTECGKGIITLPHWLHARHAGPCPGWSLKLSPAEGAYAYYFLQWCGYLYLSITEMDCLWQIADSPINSSMKGTTGAPGEHTAYEVCGNKSHCIFSDFSVRSQCAAHTWTSKRSWQRISWSVSPCWSNRGKS